MSLPVVEVEHGRSNVQAINDFVGLNYAGSRRWRLRFREICGAYQGCKKNGLFHFDQYAATRAGPSNDQLRGCYFTNRDLSATGRVWMEALRTLASRFGMVASPCDNRKAPRLIRAPGLQRDMGSGIGLANPDSSSLDDP